MTTKVDQSVAYRFYLSDAYERRWLALGKDLQLQMLLDFSKQKALAKSARPLVRGKGLQPRVVGLASCYVLLPPGLDLECIDFSHTARLNFADYATSLLKGGRLQHGELELTAKWASELGVDYVLEQVCSVGRIDVVLANELVEAKVAGSWKHALGQVLAYQFVMGSHRYSASLLLLGRRDNFDYHTIEACCKSLSIKVYWYDS